MRIRKMKYKQQHVEHIQKGQKKENCVFFFYYFLKRVGKIK